MISLRNQLNVFGRKIDFLKNQRADLSIKKFNFPENTLVYVNNSSVTPINGGHAIYLEFVIIAQILPVANPPLDLDLDTHQYQENEVLIFTSLYNLKMGFIEV